MLRLSVLLAALPVLGPGALHAAPQSLKLSGPLARTAPGGPIVGDVLAFQSAADVGRVVYRADAVADQRFELFSARLDGVGPPLSLTADLGLLSTSTPSFTVSSDGATVVFEQRDLLDSSRRLYAVSTRGGAPVLLDGPTGAFQAPYVFDASGTRVAYLRPASGPGTFELASAALDGSGTPLVLHLPAPADRTVSAPALDPDGFHVLYLADHAGVAGKEELYRVPIDASAPPRRISAPLAGIAGLASFLSAPDGRNVLYLASDWNGGNARPWHLYSVAIDGSRPVERLSRLDGLTAVTSYRITEDGRTVVFEAYKAVRRDRLYSAPVDGLRPALGTPDGAHRAEPNLLTRLPVDETVKSWSLAGDRAVYIAGDPWFASRLYSVHVNGHQEAVILNRPLGSSEQVSSFAVAPGNQEVVYFAGNQFHLSRVPVTGGSSFDYGTFQLGSGLEIAPDGTTVYALDWGQQRVLAFPFDGSRPPRALNGPLAPGGFITRFVPLRGERVLFTADRQADEVFELFEGFAGTTQPGRR